MRSGDSGDIKFSTGAEPQSPVTGGSASASPRRSSSPNDQSPSRPHTRKRTNTASSGSGDRRTANKICRVCGDKAFSYNFNVITCESCKAFFRRNANKEKDIRCPFSENCEINVVSRRFCQRCRLAKCFQVGMKKEWIMSEEARLEKKQRVEENRERRMLDAMRSDGDDAGSPRRERTRSESKTDDVPSPSSSQPVPDDMTIPLVTNIPILQNQTHFTDQSPSATMPNLLQNPPSFAEQAPNVTMPNLVAAATVHQMIDPIPTTAAHSLADVSSTTSAVQPMDVDPSSTMSGMGFIPPTIESSVPSSVATLLPVVSVTNSVESSIIAAHTQLVQAAAQQVQQVQAAQAAQQIAAAVVAHQVAQQIAAAPSASNIAPAMPQTLSTALPTPLPTAMTTDFPQAMPQQLPQTLQPSLQPVMQPNILAPTLAQPLAPQPNSLLQTLSTPMDMVTIPREVLVQLIDNNMKRAASCTCSCVCGRYPPGATIVDEVTKDLLAAGGQQNACNSCDQKDEARLETAEDFQRNGLLPSEDSSVQWLNSSQPTVVDPTTLSDNPYPPAVEPFNDNSAHVAEDPEIHTLTVYDRDVLNEVSREWSNGKLENGNRFLYLRQEPSSVESAVQAKMEMTVRELLSASRNLACFRALSRMDQLALIRERSLAYLIMRGAGVYDSHTNQWMDSESWPIVYEVQRECSMIYSQLGELKGSDEIVAVMSLLCLFDIDTMITAREDVAREHAKLVGLLKRLLYSRMGENKSRARDECSQLLKLLPLVRDLALRCGPAFKFDPVRIEAILAEAP